MCVAYEKNINKNFEISIIFYIFALILILSIFNINSYIKV